MQRTRHSTVSKPGKSLARIALGSVQENRLLAYPIAVIITVMAGWQLVLRGVESHRKEPMRARLGLC